MPPVGLQSANAPGSCAGTEAERFRAHVRLVQQAGPAATDLVVGALATARCVDVARRHRLRRYRGHRAHAFPLPDAARALRIRRARRPNRILGIWDDHDYGKNDAGQANTRSASRVRRRSSTSWESPRQPAPAPQGTYDSHEFGSAHERVKVILLDGATIAKSPGGTPIRSVRSNGLARERARSSTGAVTVSPPAIRSFPRSTATKSGRISRVRGHASSTRSRRPARPESSS